MTAPTVKFGWYWNQWMVGAMVDYGRIIPVRWIVLIIGPLTLSISAGRRG
jgi:hypothetical protein